MTELSEDVEAELELLRAMYAEPDELSVDGASVAVVLRPHTGGEEVQRFVEAELCLSLAAPYPTAAAGVTLRRVRGLLDDEERRLLRVVRARAAEEAGECCAYSLVTCALDELTEMNTGGDCAICRDELFGGDGGGVFLSKCYHSFHAKCLERWWSAYEPPAPSRRPARPTARQTAARRRRRQRRRRARRRRRPTPTRFSCGDARRRRRRRAKRPTQPSKR